MLVEDDVELSRVVLAALSRTGFASDRSGSLEEARINIRSNRYDAILLDRRLPDGDGLTLLAELRQAASASPILILSAKDTIRDRVDGLDHGADDYLVKPFDMAELIARLRALLRRPPDVIGARLALGHLELDPGSRSITVHGRLFTLPRRETTLLENLLRRSGRVVSRATLEEALYSNDSEVTPNSLEVSISRLRRRLGAVDAGIQLHTVRGVGYFVE